MFQSILSVIKYFSFFEYPPTFEEIYQFLPKKITKEKLRRELDYLIKKKIIKNLKLKIKNCDRYTVGEYSIKIHPPTRRVKDKRQNYKDYNLKNYFNDFKKRYLISKEKLNSFRFKLYIKLLSLFPQIKLVGLSGSIAMMNAKEEDDIDLFIVTARNRLFTGRMIAIALAEILGIRKRFSNKSFIFHDSSFNNKVCLNLFFDERDLMAPSFKRSLYVAHEVLQMKSMVNKNYTYERFLNANQWIISFFPNADKISNFKFLISNQFQISKFKNYQLNKNLKLIIENFGNWLENQLKKFQLSLIKKHQTNEIVTDTQLWFHPDDFEKKIEIFL